MRTRMLTLAMVLLFPVAARAVPIQVQAIRATPTSLTIFGSVTGLLDKDRVHTLGTLLDPYQVGFWSIRLTVEEFNRDEDFIHVFSVIKHASPPGHNDGLGDVTISVIADSRLEVNGTVTRTQEPVFADHGPHSDIYGTTIEATVLTVGMFRTITGYEFQIYVGHCSSPCAEDPLLETPLELPMTTTVVPEPATLASLTSGLAALALGRRGGRSPRAPER